MSLETNDHTIGYQTIDSASSLKFHHLALLALLVAVVSRIRVTQQI